MPTDETWTCPSCGSTLPASRDQCPSCRVTRIHRTAPRSSPAFASSAPKKKEAVEIVLPCYIPEVRYSIKLAAGGATWTTGLIYCTTAGFYLLSDKDGFTDETKAAEAAKEVRDNPHRIGPLSVFVPKESVKRLVHGQFLGNFLEMVDLKIPLRLTTDGWARLIGGCRKLDIKIDA